MVKFGWSVARLPENEAERLVELHRYALLDTLPEIAFDPLTEMAARRFGVPNAQHHPTLVREASPCH